jgi:hypothetical protein
VATSPNANVQAYVKGLPSTLRFSVTPKTFVLITSNKNGTEIAVVGVSSSSHIWVAHGTKRHGITVKQLKTIANAMLIREQSGQLEVISWEVIPTERAEKFMRIIH